MSINVHAKHLLNTSETCKRLAAIEMRKAREDAALRAFDLNRADMRAESVTSVATCDADVVDECPPTLRPEAE